MGQSPKNASVGWLVARHPLADSQPEHLSVGFGQVKLSIQIHWSNDWMNDIFIILTNMARGVVGALSHRTDVAKCLHDWGHCLAGLANPGVARLSPKQGREGRMGGIPPFVSRPTLLFRFAHFASSSSLWGILTPGDNFCWRDLPKKKDVTPWRAEKILD